MSYRYLLDLALILASTKVLSILSEKIKLPQVVGALIAGLLLGPACFGLVEYTEFFRNISELGVIVIMFTAGIGTDINELKKIGKAGFWVAFIGVVMPLIMGTGLAYIFNRGAFAHPGNVLLQNIFIGTVLTATSVSITVTALKELGHLNTRVGSTILAAALIDDILGLVVLALVTGLGGEDVSVWSTLLKILLFFVFIVIAYILFSKAFNWYIKKTNNRDMHRLPVASFVICLLLAFCAEKFFGVADIIGAFAAGLIVSSTSKAKYIESKFDPLSYLLLTPIFFASMGLSVQRPQLDSTIILFSVMLLIVAIVSKLIGCGLGARFSGFSNRESVQIGIGMVCRGEVALIVANKGVAMGIMPEAFFAPIIIIVIVLTIFTPIMLRVAFGSKHTVMEESSLVDSYEKLEQLEYVQQELLDKDRLLREESEGKRDEEK